MQPGDLTTLAHAKDWLEITVSTNDDMISRLITSNSAYIQAWLNRRVALQTYYERRNGSGVGKGAYMMMFAVRPVWEMISLSINGTAVLASADGALRQPGYAFDSKTIWLPRNGCGFAYGQRNIALSYRAGFVIAQVADIPATPFQITPTFLWLSNISVTVAGVALTKVASSPVAGQYSVSALGVYTFALADVGQSVTITYSYVPPDIEQACINMLALSYSGRDRIGQVSKAIGTETISYVQKDMTDNDKTLLQQYKNVVPL